MTRKAICALFQPGQRVTVTNHYITRPDHPCFGTRERTIARVSSSHLWLARDGGSSARCESIPWPPASQLQADTKIVRFYGGGVGQAPSDLFLTIERQA